MTSDQVLALTPAQLRAYLKAYNAELRFLDLQFAFVRRLLAEPYRDTAKHPAPYGIEDFVLFSESAEEIGSSTEQTWQQQYAIVTMQIAPYFEAREKYEKERAQRTEKG